MGNWLKGIVVILLVMIGYGALAQNPVYLEQLRRKSIANSPTAFDSSLNYFLLFNGKQINYLYPLYQALGKEKKFKTIFTNEGYYRNLSQLLGFAGDYSASVQALQNSYAPVDAASQKDIQTTIAGLSNIQFVSAKEFVMQAVYGNRVLMLNESRDKPQHRAFAVSLLKGLYDQGFRYLAMDMLNNYSNHQLTAVSAYTGHYTMEPAAGELAREAIDLGFTLVSYDDTAYNRHSASESDSIQAANINAILKKDSSSKIFVYASYAHIAKKKNDDRYTPMAMWLKKLSGIEPLCVDQTNLTEQSTFNYGDAFYKELIHKYTFTKPSVAIINRRPINISGSDLYDFAIIHPPTTYIHGRPDWLAFDGLRQESRVNPTEKNLFLLQAYYANEYSEKTVGGLVPADQTYIPADDGYYSLFLQKGSYILVYRDIDYDIIATRDWEVK